MSRRQIDEAPPFSSWGTLLTENVFFRRRGDESVAVWSGEDVGLKFGFEWRIAARTTGLLDVGRGAYCKRLSDGAVDEQFSREKHNGWSGFPRSWRPSCIWGGVASLDEMAMGEA